MGFLQKIWARISSPGKYIFGPRRPFWSRGSTLVDDDSSMRVAAFNRGVIYLATQMAKLPWCVKDKDNNEVYGPVSDLLNLAPNPELNAFRFRMVAVQNAIIHGNFYGEIERDGVGRPLAIWPLESSRMTLVRTDTGQLVYEYSDPSGGTLQFQPRDIFHLPNFHTKDGLVGQGVVAYGREVLGIQIAADTMAAGLFHNSGIPSAVLSHPGRLSEDAYKRLKESWDAEQGGRKSGKTSILEEGVKYEAINTDPNALQFLESRQFGVLEIARFLGIPPTKLFDVKAATYSNVENANLEVATDTLDAWATNLEMEADVKLLNNRYGGRYTDIDLYSVFRGDMETRGKYFKDMISVAAITPNQIRAREGLPGYGAKGDNYYIATNNFTPVDRMDELIDADIVQKKKPNASPSANPPAKRPEDDEAQKAAIRYLLGDDK